MSHYQHKMLIIMLAALFWLPSLFSAEKEPAPIISAQFKCVSLGGPMPDGVDILIGPNKRLHLNTPATYIEPSIQYTGPAILTLVRPEKKPASHQSPSDKTNPLPLSAEPEVLASVEIPAPGGDYLLIFAKAADQQLRVLAVPFSSADVPPDSCLVWNITSRALGVILGDQKELMQPQARLLFKPTMIVKNYLDLRVFDEYEGKSRPLIGGPHFLPEKCRQLIFIAERIPGSAPIQIKVIEEIPELTSRPKSNPQLTAFSR